MTTPADDFAQHLARVLGLSKDAIHIVGVPTSPGITATSAPLTPYAPLSVTLTPLQRDGISLTVDCTKRLLKIAGEKPKRRVKLLLAAEITQIRLENIKRTLAGQPEIHVERQIELETLFAKLLPTPDPAPITFSLDSAWQPGREESTTDD